MEFYWFLFLDSLLVIYRNTTLLNSYSILIELKFSTYKVIVSTERQFTPSSPIWMPYTSFFFPVAMGGF